MSSTVSTTARRVCRTGPNQRSARVTAARTAKTKTGSSTVDSRHQLVNGSGVRPAAPIASRSDISQNPSA